MAMSVMGAGALLACGARMPRRHSFHEEQVELLEDGVAEVVDLESGRTAVVPRRTLPRGVEEGDVLVDGRVDPIERAKLLQRIAELHSSFVPSGNLQL